MKSSAKLTAFSFLAAVALGAAAFTGGCTVTSGTVNDTDGGNGNDDDAGEGGSDAGDSATPVDSGGRTCSVPNQKGIFGSAACQACLDTSCCADQQACFAIPADQAAGTVDCNDYTDCVNVCNEKPTDEEKVKCYEETCDVVAAAGVKDAYDKIDTCKTTNCATACQ